MAALGGQPAPDLEGVRLDGARLLVLEDADVLPTRAAPLAAFEAAAARLAAAGARLDRRRIPAVPEALRLFPTVAAGEAYGVWRAAIEAQPELMFAPIRERFRGGAAILAADYVAACRALDAQRAAWRAATAGWDAVLMPTTANLPPNVAQALADPTYYAAENLLALRNPTLANLLGLCAVSLPTGIPCCGLMAMAGPGEEARLLRLASAMERALG